MTDTTTTKILGSLSVIVIVLFAACLSSMGGTPTTPTETPEGDGDTRPWSGTEFRFDHLSSNESGFYFETDVWHSLPENGNTTFDDVMLCLYDEQGNVLNSTSLGSIETRHGWIYNVSITAKERPTFIFVDHPRFHQYSNVDTEFLTRHETEAWGNETFRILHRNVDTLNETLPFEYPRHDEPGRCM